MAAIMILQLPIRSGSYVEFGTSKMWYKRSDCIAILYGNRVIILTTSWDACISRLTAAILNFRLPLLSDNILLSVIELVILEHMERAFGISILSRLQAEIHAFPI